MTRPNDSATTPTVLDNGSREGDLLAPALLQMLWPTPCRIEWALHDSGSDNGVAYVAIPNWASPSVIAPRRPRKVMASLIRGYNTAGHGRTRILAELAALGASTGLTDIAFQDVWIDDTAAGPDTSISKFLSAALGRQVALSISIGPGRAVQKPVIQVAESDGRTLAFAKVGHNELTRNLVRREAQNLKRVAAALDSAGGVEVPEVVVGGSWRDTEVLVQTALPRGRPPRRDQFLRAMRTVSYLDGISESSITSSAYWSDLCRRIELLPPSRISGTLQSVAAAVRRWDPPVLLPFGAWHGDMTPWNITALPDAVRIWDWEHFQPNVPVGFDVLHYGIRRRCGRRSASATQAVLATTSEAHRDLRALGVPVDAAPWTILLYLLEIATRYVEDGEEDKGTELGRLRWLEPSLRQHISQGCGMAW